MGGFSCPDGYSVEEGSPTNVWSARRVVYNDRGQRVFTLLSEPRSRMLPANAGLLEVSNEWLYHGLGFDGVVALAARFQPMAVRGFSRVDLCADFVPTLQQQGVIEGLASGEYYIGGKRNGSLFWSVNATNKERNLLAARWRDRPIPHCQSWGHKTTAVKWKLYYKSKELADAGGGAYYAKPYIVDTWRMAGFDVSDVWRLEVSIKHGNEYEWEGGGIVPETFSRYLISIFADVYARRFVVRRQQGHADRTNDEWVPFLATNQLVGSFRRRKPASLAVSDAHITLLRHLISSADEPSVMFDLTVRDEVLAMVERIVEADGLQEYFYRMTGKRLGAWVLDHRNALAASNMLEPPRNRGSISRQADTMRPNTWFEADARVEVTDSDAAARRKSDIAAFVASLRL